MALHIVCFCVTLVLLALSLFVFRDDIKGDIALIIVGVPELTGLIITLVRRRK